MFCLKCTSDGALCIFKAQDSKCKSTATVNATLIHICRYTNKHQSQTCRPLFSMFLSYSVTVELMYIVDKKKQPIKQTHLKNANSFRQELYLSNTNSLSHTHSHVCEFTTRWRELNLSEECEAGRNFTSLM